MSSRITKLAAHNNALWCDAVCRAHGHEGEFRDFAWLNRIRTPRFYPDMVTLAGAQAARAHSCAVTALLDMPRPGGWSIKDSFFSLDLRPHGFVPLFDAEWICFDTPRRAAKPTSAHWIIADSEAALAAWEERWAAANATSIPGPDERIFKPALLAEPGLVFASLHQDGTILGGGIINHGAGIVGLSNLFAAQIETEGLWSSLVDLAATRFPGLPIVAYDRGEDLQAAQRAGFTIIGPLRIWQRPQ